MIADITLPPFTTLLLIIGAVLIVLALAGQISIKEATVGIPQRGLRVLAGIIGVALIGIAVWLFFEPITTAHPPSSDRTKGTPAFTPPATQVVIPLERYKELIGKWEIVETVRPPYGDYEIIWNYDATVIGNRLTMQGKKMKVAEPNRVRPVRQDEKAVVSVYTLDLTGLDAEGMSNEKSADGIIQSNLKIHFSEDLKSLSGTFKTGGSEVSSLYGSKQ